MQHSRGSRDSLAANQIASNTQKGKRMDFQRSRAILSEFVSLSSQALDEWSIVVAMSRPAHGCLHKAASLITRSVYSPTSTVVDDWSWSPSVDGLV